MWLRDAVLVKDPHFTLVHHGVSTEIRLDHGGSWVQIPSGARIFFSEFPFDANTYHVIISKRKLQHLIGSKVIYLMSIECLHNLPSQRLNNNNNNFIYKFRWYKGLVPQIATKLLEAGQDEHENIMEKNYNKLQTCWKTEKRNFT